MNPNLIGIAERVRRMPSIRTGADYHAELKKTLKRGQIPYQFPKKPYTANLGGVDFDVLEAEVTIQEMTVRQKYFIAIMKGYALGFITSFNTPAQEKELEDILKTVQFSK